MKEELNKHRVGLSVGIFIAFMHFLWSAVALFGLTEFLLKTVLRLHFLSIQFTLLPFELFTAVILIINSFICGYIGGWVFAWIWNWAGKK